MASGVPVAPAWVYIMSNHRNTRPSYRPTGVPEPTVRNRVTVCPLINVATIRHRVIGVPVTYWWS